MSCSPLLRLVSAEPGCSVLICLYVAEEVAVLFKPLPLLSLHHHPGVLRQAGETILTNLVRLSNYALDLQMYVGYCVFFCLFKPNKI